MPSVLITLTFPSIDEAQLFLTAGKRALENAIVHEDRPDVGAAPDFSAAFPAPAPAPSPDSTGFNPFALRAAPSTAVAAAPSTAPEAPTPTSTAPANVPPAPAQSTAPEAAAPATPAAPTSPVGTAVDADGLPWDARIHAGGRATNADGRWRQKRGLNDAALKARVEAELRQAMGAPVAASVPAPPTPAATDVPVPPPPTAPATPAGETFPSLAARIGPHLVSGKLTQDQLGGVLATFGLQSMSQLAVRPDLCGPIGQALDALVAA
jgi:hypothetical protein